MPRSRSPLRSAAEMLASIAGAVVFDMFSINIWPPSYKLPTLIEVEGGLLVIGLASPILLAAWLETRLRSRMDHWLHSDSIWQWLKRRFRMESV